MNIKYLLLIFITFKINAQTSYIYKKELGSGNIQVYQGNNGRITGKPLVTYKRNLTTGYLEVIDHTSYNTKYYERPQLEATDWQVEMLNQQIDALNTNRQIQNIQKQNNLKQDRSDMTEMDNFLKKLLGDNNAKANHLLEFFNNFQDKPKQIQNGWNICYWIYESNGRKLQFLLYAYVIDNKIEGLYTNYNGSQGHLFATKFVPQLLGDIKDCKAVIKEDDKFSYIYFIDQLVNNELAFKENEVAKVKFTNIPIKGAILISKYEWSKEGKGLRMDYSDFYVLDYPEMIELIQKNQMVEYLVPSNKPFYITVGAPQNKHWQSGQIKLGGMEYQEINLYRYFNN